MTKQPLKEALLSGPSHDHWKRISVNKRAGVLTPLFSLYSKESLGVGELADLKLLVDWCVKTGNSIIQLLPMNELGPIFCPYDSISSFALEPVYLSMRLIAGASAKSIKAKIEHLKKTFPAGKQYVDYCIKGKKLSVLWDIFLLEDNLVSQKEFQRFIKENSYWIHDFALFKVLKEHHDGKPWYDWEGPYKNRDKNALKDFGKEHEEAITYHKWVQWQLYRQFTDAKSYAVSKKVLLKGDLPILVSRDSADVWAHPEFFKLSFCAGAPPDMYCAKGQRWGMPTYDWEKIREDGYTYIKEKLKYAENFYDILRIDHIVGLFRIWSIPYNDPLENQGLNGFFDLKDEKEWARHGKTILSLMIKSTSMLLCGEDLGMIPKVCPKTMEKFGIPGNDVQRWVKDWAKKHDFLNPEEYRALSVAMLSTHDTTNWAAWWENEAGTVDEDLFRRKCADRGIDYGAVRGRIFDELNSQYGRLRWRDEIGSVDTLLLILGKREEEVKDFVEMYQNTYREKEKLWKKLHMKGAMREESDAEIIRAAFGITLGSRSIFCIELILDLLSIGNICKGDPYAWRINKPGTIRGENWSLAIPISLEELLAHKVSHDIKKLITASGRNKDDQD